MDRNIVGAQIMTYLRADLTAWGGNDPFAAAIAQQGQIYRDKEGRRTLRFEWQGRPYFLKLHQGVGWGEVFKNLLQGRLPVLGAENEYRAILALERAGLATLTLAGYGKRGLNPAQQQSFLLTDELNGVATACTRIETRTDPTRRRHCAPLSRRRHQSSRFLSVPFYVECR
jgi:hypothetical protein